MIVPTPVQSPTALFTGLRIGSHVPMNAQGGPFHVNADITDLGANHDGITSPGFLGLPSCFVELLSRFVLVITSRLQQLVSVGKLAQIIVDAVHGWFVLAENDRTSHFMLDIVGVLLE